MVLIFVHKSSPRLQYIAAFIFKELIKTPYSITSHKESFINFEGIKINYTEEKIAEDEIHIHPSGLLHQQGIQPQEIEIFESIGNAAFFRSFLQQQNNYPFDIFAATFYLLTRYEEYLPHKKDKYGRYDHTNSLAFNHNFLHLPLLNIWIDDFLKTLQKRYPQIHFTWTDFKFIPTYDVDIAYSYLHKGLLRNAGGVLGSLLTLKFKSLLQRSKTLISKKDDPFDNYEWLHSLDYKYGLNPVYFFLVAEKNGLYDKNILPRTVAMQQLIKEHAEKYAIGLHPSWQSGDDKNLLIKEKQILEKIADQNITKGRQHYLRMSLPATYQQLLKAGITDDYTMGYGAVNGFRASVATTFFWYDIEKEEQTKLRVHPFCYMDSVSIHHQKTLPQQGFNEMVQYYNVCQKYSGTFICIMHNHLLVTKQWRNVYEKFLKETLA